jgi:Pectate lyase superfamily protein
MATHDKTASTGTMLQASATGSAAVTAATAGVSAYTPTAIQTGAIAAAVGQLVLVNVAAAAATVSLPAAPANLSLVAVKAITSGYASASSPTPYTVTIQCGGSDTIDNSSATSVQISTLNQLYAFQYDSALATWLLVDDEIPMAQLDGRSQRVVSVRAAPFSATGNGVTDDTKAIQAAINYATAIHATTFLPSSGTLSYRVSNLVLPQGAILRGVSSGTYPGNQAIPGVSTLTRLAGTNSDLLTIADGSNYCRIRDIQLDGNKNNNTAGDGIHISDGAAGQEAQVLIERCYVHDNPGHNIYLGKNRRASKVTDSVCNYAGKDGICVAGSDNTVGQNICGSNGRAGINLGTTTALRWAADANPNSAAVTHVVSNDVYGNLVGINVAASSWGNVIGFNGIDRNSDEGVAVYDGDMAATIQANVFHSNGVAIDDTYPHIGLGTGVLNLEIAANVFAALDGGVSNVANYCVHAASAQTSISGDLGITDATSTNHGLIYAAAGVWNSTSGASTGTWTAADQGLLAWTEDPSAAAANSQIPVAGTLYLRRVHVPIACSVTNVLVNTTAAGSSLSNCYAALFTASGTRVAGSADQSSSGSNWSSGTGIKTVPLAGGPYTITAGDYYVGVIANGTTLPSVARSNSQGAAMVNVGLASGFRTATGGTGNVSVPASTGTLTASAYAFWMGLS